MAAKASFFEREEAAMKEELTKEKPPVLKKNEGIYNSLNSLNKRSMVLDEENFEDVFLRCNVCKDRFSEPDKTPKILNCHHSFCMECILKLFKTEAEYRLTLTPSLRGMPTAVTIHCPSCRHNFISTEENLRQLPTDHRIVQLMDFVKHTDRYTVTFCSKHNMQPLNFFCEPCIKPVCRDCTVIDHRETTGHLVMDLEQAMKKYTPLLDKALTEMQNETKLLEEKRMALESTIIRLDRTKIDLLQSIHQTFDKIRVSLCERERELRDIAESEITKERTRLTEKIQLLKARNTTLKEHSKQLKSAKDESNVEEMFRTHQDIRESRIAPPIKVREFDDGLLTTFSFNSTEDGMLLSKLSNFGDINSKVEHDTLRPRGALKARIARR
ncbi:tripartite motif-containing protein 2 [Patella vulgata]|uniref:tripartite motif-containing protein 2 n=1 Tax=Patella vulgata TaxID=6465 RepID=UPI0021804F9A|nr:tripartite motif-containing protein 2 [Patella vulgata]